MNDNIIINDYISFNPIYCRFELSSEAQELLYRKKQVICSYSGCIEWGHDFFCQLLDFYSGMSIYNHTIGCFKHKEEFEQGQSCPKEVSIWIKKHKNDEWFVKAANMMESIINDAPKYC